MCGGFIWEFCDHAVYGGRTRAGKDIYLYGGDNGELQHDGNFCLDGLVYPDRRPHTSLFEYRNVYRPLRSSYDLASRKLTISNHMDFTDPEKVISASYALVLDGNRIAEGILTIPSIKPRTSVSIDLPLNIPSKGRCFLWISYVIKKSQGALPAGHELGFDEIRIPVANPRYARTLMAMNNASCDTGYPLSHQDKGNLIIISGKGFNYKFDKRTGMPALMNFEGEELLDKPIEFNFWRAPVGPRPPKKPNAI